MKWMMFGKKLSLALSLVVPCFLPVIGSAETVYTVTESQMQIWTQGLYKLKSNNETLQAQLATQQERSTLLLEQLTESQSEIAKAQNSQEQAQASLQSLKASLTTYEEQSAKTERRLKRQRGVWAAIAALAAGWAVSRT